MHEVGKQGVAASMVSNFYPETRMNGKIVVTEHVPQPLEQKKKRKQTVTGNLIRITFKVEC